MVRPGQGDANLEASWRPLGVASRLSEDFSDETGMLKHAVVHSVGPRLMAVREGVLWLTMSGHG